MISAAISNNAGLAGLDTLKMPSGQWNAVRCGK